MLEQAIPFLLVTWAALALVFAVLWWRQSRTRNATSVDAGWAVSIGAVAVIAALLADGSPLQRTLAGVLAGAWSLRLAWHLLADRVLSGAAEDGRYRALREYLGDRERLGFFLVYQLQALLALGFATPFVLTAFSTATALSGLHIAGIALAAVSQGLEALADRQLAAHRSDPAQRGRTCRRGLWRYSRHPNYFFEWLTWCGFGLVHATALGWYATVAPLAMLLSIRFFSGVPFTEKRALASRGDDYRRYMAATNAFFPWPPRVAPQSDVTES